jgi:hypothetical protein
VRALAAGHGEAPRHERCHVDIPGVAPQIPPYSWGPPPTPYWGLPAPRPLVGCCRTCRAMLPQYTHSNTIFIVNPQGYALRGRAPQRVELPPASSAGPHTPWVTPPLEPARLCTSRPTVVQVPHDARLSADPCWSLLQIRAALSAARHRPSPQPWFSAALGEWASPPPQTPSQSLHWRMPKMERAGGLLKVLNRASAVASASGPETAGLKPSMSTGKWLFGTSPGAPGCGVKGHRAGKSSGGAISNQEHALPPQGAPGRATRPSKWS